MKGLAFTFLVLAVISAVLGMIWGIVMSATGDHTMTPAHAHLNLLGWVTLAIYGFYYHLVPQAGETGLAKLHFLLAVAGLVIVIPGIYLAVSESTETAAKLGSMLILASMLVFGAIVMRNRNTA